jgi:chemotaxis protein methyltransferase CheR
MTTSPITDAEFEFLRGFLKTQSGLALANEKRYLLESRLAPLCPRFKCQSIGEIVTQLRGNKSKDLEKAVVDAMTTNETFFFRDKMPFDLFKDVMLPQYLASRASTRRLRIWCAACSSGQEPYSLAMILDQAKAKLTGWQFEIIATDLSNDILEKAKQGVYSQFEVQRGLPVNLMMTYFKQNGDLWQINQNIRSMIQFKPINLIKDFSALGTFDIIFCRNVLIYFDAPTKSQIMKRLADSLQNDGSLLLGAAETVIGLTESLSPHGTHRGLYVPTKGLVKAPMKAVG